MAQRAKHTTADVTQRSARAGRARVRSRSSSNTPPTPPAAQIPRRGKAAKPQWSGAQDTPARVAAAGVLEALRAEMLMEQPGIEAGRDPEHLHRYRVALRRTRTLLGQLRRILPARRAAALRNELAWLAELTTHVRDMDVYLAHWPDYRREVPAARRKHLAPLHTHLETRRERLRNILLRALRSDRYRALMRLWQDLESRLREPPGKKFKTIGAFASKRIERLRQRVLDEAAVLDENSPPLHLHELRKTCKKLRYMLEFSRNLLPKDALRELLSRLKDLQDALGAMHDLYVHHAALGEFSQALAADGTPVQTQQAVTVLLDHLAAKRQGAFAAVERQLQEFTALIAQPHVVNLIAGISRPA